MLIPSENHDLFIAVILVPTVVLVNQQAEVIMMHTDLKVGKYYGDLGVDFWDAATWKWVKDEHEVLVMTPAILLSALRHRFLGLNNIKVMIFDECHNARRSSPYACIMKEFYHQHFKSDGYHLPRIFGMTASPVKAKGSNSAASYWKQISDLENLMHSKVFTCENESVLAQYVPFSTPKVKMYKYVDTPHVTIEDVANELSRLIKKHELSLPGSCISNSAANSAKKRLLKIHTTDCFCLSELGVWLAVKAAEVLSHEENNIFSWRKLDVRHEAAIRAFNSNAFKVFSACMRSGPEWSIRHDIKASTNAGYLTSRVTCLVETLLEYREMKDLRCIIFVERIITAIVLSKLLNELFPEVSGWRTEYTAGHTSPLFSDQERTKRNCPRVPHRQGKHHSGNLHA